VLVWVNEALVPQVEMTPDASSVVDEPLLQVLLSLQRSELARLSQMVADLHSRAILSADEEELRALWLAVDASEYERRSLDGEIVLALPAADETGAWLARGLAEQVMAVPVRWRADVAAALFTLVADIEDSVRDRRRRLVLVAVAAAAATTGLIVLGLRAILQHVRR
jgi:hypothetical protein